MNGAKTEFFIDNTRRYGGSNVEIRALMDHGQHRPREVITDLVCCPHKDGELVAPFMSLKMDEAQNLCDALWEAGVRPTNGAGSTGQLAATQAHLSDVRTLVFDMMRGVVKL